MISPGLYEGYYSAAKKSANKSFRLTRKIAKAIEKLDGKIDEVEKTLSKEKGVHKTAYEKKLQQLLLSRNILASKIDVPLRFTLLLRDESKYIPKQIKRASKNQQGELTNKEKEALAQAEQPSLFEPDEVFTFTKDKKPISQQEFDELKKKVLGESKPLFRIAEEISTGKSFTTLFEKWLKDKASQVSRSAFEQYIEDIDTVRVDFIRELINKYKVDVDKILENPMLSKAFKTYLQREALMRKITGQEKELPEDVMMLVDVLKQVPYNTKVGKNVIEIVRDAYSKIAKELFNVGKPK